MTEIKLHQFGSRWSEYKKDGPWLSSLGGTIPTVSEDQSISARQARTRDPMTAPFFMGVMGTSGFLLNAMFKNYDKTKNPLLDYITGDPERYSILIYLILLLFYAVYVARYYRVIWYDYYSLFESSNNDFSDFQLYGYAIFFVSVPFMLVVPLYWPLSFVILFTFLAYKKNRTKMLFCRAADEFLNGEDISDVGNLLKNGTSIKSLHLTLPVRRLIAARVL